MTAVVGVSITGTVVTPDIATSVVFAEEENPESIDYSPTPKAVNVIQIGKSIYPNRRRPPTTFSTR